MGIRPSLQIEAAPSQDGKSIGSLKCRTASNTALVQCRTASNTALGLNAKRHEPRCRRGAHGQHGAVFLPLPLDAAAEFDMPMEQQRKGDCHL